MSASSVLQQAAQHAVDYLQAIDKQPIRTSASLSELRRRLGRELPEHGVPAIEVIDDLVADAAGGILGSGSGRFYGWVIGGSLPVALAADWLTSTWDQNAASNVTAPAEAVVEEIAGAWLKHILNLPDEASFAFVTGCQMAHTTAFAAARHHLLQQRGWDVEVKGLQGAPNIRVLTSENRHESILRAVRLLGLGTEAVTYVASDSEGRMDPGALDAALSGPADRATIVSLQAGDLNTGVFDVFKALCPIARKHEAWVHVDGAFGLWAAASPRYRHLLEGVEQANSWATDGHKWLNLPFDSGFVFVAEPAAHRAAFSQATSYAVPLEDLRNQKDWNPEWSRRGRGFAAYAALRHLGRLGVQDLVERCCDHACRLVESIAALEGAEALAHPVINQGLVRFLSPDGDHDRRTDEVIAALQSSGDVWFGGVTWQGKRAMRISVCNWLTTDADIDRTIEVVRRVLREMSRPSI
ncbi:pyridoxal phosphate-dependent decarboxylase family protein [Denitrobaculum tricleocarpae]|uniref:Aspartate aminotransferase family protein n=1 Tax=Denitrobaculum tricleocarpae TaxID=2591009 RepID=A0A545TWT0_9PROT|nr:aminotransferase class V-fold PLP-dependent enzyme [Denitrobaculum tricleocarpae]TQV81675.1 aspartate aminotransferase family protein [Denitrobaculum tricleocarpae]